MPQRLWSPEQVVFIVQHRNSRKRYQEIANLFNAIFPGASITTAQIGHVLDSARRRERISRAYQPNLNMVPVAQPPSMHYYVPVVPQSEELHQLPVPVPVLARPQYDIHFPVVAQAVNDARVVAEVGNNDAVYGSSGVSLSTEFVHSASQGTLTITAEEDYQIHGNIFGIDHQAAHVQRDERNHGQSYDLLRPFDRIGEHSNLRPVDNVLATPEIQDDVEENGSSGTTDRSGSKDRVTQQSEDTHSNAEPQQDNSEGTGSWEDFFDFDAFERDHQATKGA